MEIETADDQTSDGVLSFGRHAQDRCWLLAAGYGLHACPFFFIVILNLFQDPRRNVC